MRFRDWRIWVNSLPPWKKWFVYLILIRPITDPFYQIKLPILAVSPLEIIGVFVPLIIVSLYLTRQLPQITPSKIDRTFRFWSVFVIINAIFFWAQQPSIVSFGGALKLTLPIYLFWYLRYFVNSAQDVRGILMTVLISSIIPAGMILYETFVGPLKSIRSRGMVRLEGVYADVGNYAIYVSLSCLASMYFFLSKEVKLSERKKRQLLGFVVVLCSFCLIKMNHTSSYGVFVALLGVFVLYNLKKKAVGNLVFLLLIGLAFSTFVVESIEDRIKPLVSSDLAVLRGENDVRHAFHGRMSRWQRYMGYFDELPIESKVFGAPLTGSQQITGMVLGIHNDYLRITFMSGVFGVFIYLVFLLQIFKMTKYLNLWDGFLVKGALLIIILYSVSAVPTIYAPLMYIILGIFAYAASPSAWLQR